MLSPEAQQLAAGSPEILTELPDDVQMRRLKRELIDGARARQELTILQSRRIAEANREFEGRVWNGGAGIRLVGRYHLRMHHEFMGRYGDDCWRDPDFLEDTLAKNPWMRIEQHKRVRILVDGFQRKVDRQEDAGGNRASGRTGDPLLPQPSRQGLVQGIEHPPVSASRGPEHQERAGGPG